MHDDEQDRLMVEQTLNGDRNAFGGLVRKYERPVYNAAYRILGNPSDAEDAAQTAFVKAFENLGTYRPEYRFYSWMYRIAVNEALNLRKKRRPAQDIDLVPVESDSSPERALHEQEQEERVGNAMMDLSPEDRALILLRHYQDLSYRDLSYVFEVPVKTIKSRLFTARSRLRVICESHQIRFEA